MPFFNNRIFSNMDCLWHCTPAEPRPNWNGFMEDVTKGIHPARTDIAMLPIIDLNCNNERWIYSTFCNRTVKEAEYHDTINHI